MTAPHFATAVELAEGLGSGQFGSRELLELFLGRVDGAGSALNAVVALDVDRARATAVAADDASSRGEVWGPLHGLPMTVKDAFETAGLVTTSGAPSLRGYVPSVDALAVARLRDAGAVIFGKTNLPMLAGDVQSYNDVYGTTNNPWDPRLGVGGSSGGSAAALAAGLTGFELGSDLGGSVRNPAHFCGVYALKPTYGLVPCRGHIPGPPGTLAEMDVASPGPMGRSVADLVLGLDVLAGPVPEQARAWSVTVPETRVRDIRDMRVAAWLDDPAAPIGAGVGGVLAAAIDGLREAGMTIDDDARPGPTLAELVDLWVTLTLPMGAAHNPDDALWELACAQESTPRANDEPRGLGALGAIALRHRDWLAANEQRQRHLARFRSFFEDYDALLTPVAPVPAFAHELEGNIATRTLDIDGEQRPHTDILAWPSAFGGIWLPAASLPVGFTNTGLPVGIQVVGPYLGDRTVLAIAAAIEQTLGGFRPPPAFAT